MICAAPSYLAARGTPRSTVDLAGHNCLGYTLAQAGASRWRMGGTAAIDVGVSGNLRANNGDALLAAALAGQGLIYQPSFIVGDDLRAGRLVPIALEQPPSDQLAVYAVYLPGRTPSAKVRAFIDFIENEVLAPQRVARRG
jgi:DNA-binding transcriptional LysR family regulator